MEGRLAAVERPLGALVDTEDCDETQEARSPHSDERAGPARHSGFGTCQDIVIRRSEISAGPTPASMPFGLSEIDCAQTDISLPPLAALRVVIAPANAIQQRGAPDAAAEDLHPAGRPLETRHGGHIDIDLSTCLQSLHVFNALCCTGIDQHLGVDLLTEVLEEGLHSQPLAHRRHCNVTLCLCATFWRSTPALSTMCPIHGLPCTLL